jgi:hypothetical protein
MIGEVENILTKEKLFELSYWYTNSENPQIVNKKLHSYYKTRQEAENAHNDLLVKGLIENETCK